MLVLDPKISEKLKKEESEFAKTLVFQIPLQLETRFVAGIPSPSYISFFYLQYCKTVEIEEFPFINHFLDSLQKVIFVCFKRKITSRN